MTLFGFLNIEIGEARLNKMREFNLIEIEIFQYFMIYKDLKAFIKENPFKTKLKAIREFAKIHQMSQRKVSKVVMIMEQEFLTDSATDHEE